MHFEVPTSISDTEGVLIYIEGSHLEVLIPLDGDFSVANTVTMIGEVIPIDQVSRVIVPFDCEHLSIESGNALVHGLEELGLEVAVTVAGMPFSRA
jgi:hypothetical protein